MSDKPTYPLRIALEVQHFESGEVFWSSTQTIFVSVPFKISKEIGLLQLYLRLFDRFPVSISHSNCSIYHVLTSYWGVHPLTGITGHLLKSPLHHYNQIGPATPHLDGSFSIKYIFLIVPKNIPLPPRLSINLQSLISRHHGIRPNNQT